MDEGYAEVYIQFELFFFLFQVDRLDKIRAKKIYIWTKIKATALLFKKKNVDTR